MLEIKSIQARSELGRFSVGIFEGGEFHFGRKSTASGGVKGGKKQGSGALGVVRQVSRGCR